MDKTWCRHTTDSIASCNGFCSWHLLLQLRLHLRLGLGLQLGLSLCKGRRSHLPPHLMLAQCFQRSQGGKGIRFFRVWIIGRGAASCSSRQRTQYCTGGAGQAAATSSRTVNIILRCTDACSRT